jgi:hypothetical protein
MKYSTCIFSCLILATAGCVEPHQAASSKPRMTESQVLKIAEEAMVIRVPSSIEAYRPYHAEYKDGSWSVWGTVPDGMRGGGDPELVIRDSDGKVLNLYFGR